MACWTDCNQAYRTDVFLSSAGRHFPLNEKHVRAGYGQQTRYLAHVLSSDQLQSFQESGEDLLDVSVAGRWSLWHYIWALGDWTSFPIVSPDWIWKTCSKTPNTRAFHNTWTNRQMSACNPERSCVTSGLLVFRSAPSIPREGRDYPLRNNEAI